MSNEYEKAKLGAETFEVFCDQFGEDEYAKILLEVLMEGLLYEETLFVFGEQEQEGDQIDHSLTGGVDSDRPSDRFIDSQTSPALGEEDISNYP